MLSRRTFLTQLIAAAGATLNHPSMAGFTQNLSSEPIDGRIPWKNWSGSQICYPKNRIAPESVAQLQNIVRETKGKIRPVGSGHSFTSLVPTNDTIISLSRLSGLVNHSQSKQQAVIQSGTRLGDIGLPLAEVGQAFTNMPDIDEQSLAGALATATHGTGANIGCMSSFVTQLDIILANGDVVQCNKHKNTDLFNAARVSLGALGIVTRVTMQNSPMYRLKRETEWLPIEEILEQSEQLANENRNFEFFYIPYSGYGFVDVQNITKQDISKTDKLDQNDGVETLKELRDWLKSFPKLREIILSTYAKTIKNEVTIANSWQNYASERNVRFNEMEYHLPRENMVNAFKEIRSLIEMQFPEVFFPLEIRFIKKDDIWLSPFYQQDSCSIAIHRYHKEDFKPYFEAVEPIFKKYGGRPHWGKLNTLKSNEIGGHYPYWQAFKDIRKEVDPQQKFLNPYLSTLFDAA